MKLWDSTRSTENTGSARAVLPAWVLANLEPTQNRNWDLWKSPYPEREIGDRVYRDLRRMILTGELPPGTRLVQRQLASLLGASSIPVLEATRRLESDGLVVYNQGIGARVKTWNEDDIVGIFLFIEILEVTAARLFAEKATPVERLILAEYGERFDGAVRQGDVEACAGMDLAIHLHIVKCTKSSTLLQYAENSSVLTSVIGGHYQAGNSILCSVGTHNELISALSGTDPDLADEATRKHVRNKLSKWLGRRGKTECKAHS